VRDADGFGVVGENDLKESKGDDVAVFVGTVELAFGPLEGEVASEHEEFFGKVKGKDPLEYGAVYHNVVFD